MKKKISVIIAALMIPAQLTAGAAVINNPQEINNPDGVTTTLTISGQIPVDSERPSGKEVIIRVYEKSSTNKLQIEHMEQTTANADGEYSITYVKSSDSGDYRIEVNYASATSGATPQYITHNYLSPALFTQFFTDLDNIYARKNEVGFDAPNELYNKLVYYAGQNAISIPKMQEMINNSEDVTEVTSYMLNGSYKDSNGDGSITKVIELFNEGYTLYKINSATSSTLDAVLSDSFMSPYINLNAEIYTTYSNNDKTNVLSIMAASDYTTLPLFAQKFADTVLVDRLSGQIAAAMYQIIYDNNTAIGINFAGYNALGEKQSTALANFAANISQVKGTATCKSVWDAAVLSVQGSSPESSNNNNNFDKVEISGQNSNNGYTVEINQPTNIKKSEDADDYFTDLAGYEWANEAIAYLAMYDYIQGDGDGKFRPGDLVTRAEFLKMVIEATRMKNAPSTGKTFADVSENAWYKTYVDRALGAEIVNGINENEFGPNLTIKRADAAVIAMRILKYFGQEFTQKNIVYSDVREDYAFDSIYQAAEAGVMQGVGDNRFEPNRGLTRAEAAKVVYNIHVCKGDYIE